ncbi:MAG TPA: HAD family hydrolase [Actinophytocola sp.]|uniref:D-glycero-alpha-D-manno-heptose-1,7-bisphosphate 7-phosphatase n=1 Tax=Actinophytocola sp. TaxID=1872138 RepID=UPI002DDDB203|nr:HAD family hydrolase [Actinophytocola sp.]HEV2781344.1 HAD family hydrolase [Actinophytocola sp.]
MTNETAETDLAVEPNVSPKRALFLDRDGVINVDYGYVHTRASFHFIEGIFDLVIKFRRQGFLCIVVTNSAGIARGYFSESYFRRFSDWILNEFARAGAPLDAIYYCPHHPSVGIAPYKRECGCRKPRPGMILRAALEFDVSLADSILVGDRDTDILAGAHAGIRRLFLYDTHSRHRGDSPTSGLAARVSALSEISVHDYVHQRRGPDRS